MNRKDLFELYDNNLKENSTNYSKILSPENLTNRRLNSVQDQYYNPSKYEIYETDSLHQASIFTNTNNNSVEDNSNENSKLNN
jgi:hypothetical protein